MQYSAKFSKTMVSHFGKSKYVRIQKKREQYILIKEKRLNNFLVLVKCLRITSSCWIGQMIQFQKS